MKLVRVDNILIKNGFPDSFQGSARKNQVAENNFEIRRKQTIDSVIKKMFLQPNHVRNFYLQYPCNQQMVPK